MLVSVKYSLDTKLISCLCFLTVLHMREQRDKPKLQDLLVNCYMVVLMLIPLNLKTDAVFQNVNSMKYVKTRSELLFPMLIVDYGIETRMSMSIYLVMYI